MQLSNYVTIKSGKRMPKGFQLTSKINNHPYIKVKDMGSYKTKLNDSFEYVPDIIVPIIKKYTVNTDDVILSIVGTIGNVSIIDESLNNANLTENCVKLVTNNLLLSKFLYYFLISNRGKDEIMKGVIGSTQPKLPFYNIEKINIDVPCINSQQHIVDTIGSMDDLIEQKEIENKKINQLIQLIFIKNTKKKDKIRIGDLNGYKIIKSGIEDFNCKKIYLDTASVDKYGISSRDYIITNDNKPSRANMQPIPKSIWFAKLKDSPKYLFVQGYMNDILDNYIFSTGFLGLEGDTRFIANYLYALITSDDFETQKNSLSIGATMQGINNDSFKEILVPNITVDEMNEIGEALDNLLVEIYNNNLKIKHLSELKQLYLKKFFG